MPIYEYQCPECDNVFEEWCKSYDQECAPCPDCRAEGKRIISNTAFILKGGGWYADGYSGEGGKKAESNGTGDKAGDGAGEKTSANGDGKAAASSGGDATPAKSEKAAKPAKKESKPASGAAKNTSA